MMETKPIVWKALDQHEPFACFMCDCQKRAEHFGKIRHGEAVFHVCLCPMCQSKSVQAILEGLTMHSGRGDKTKADQQRRCTEGDVK